ncbi:VWD domain-containing protein [Spirosoma soli]|uniref:VWD domain-containing protein n=1 Tax=Spirosoma soli TaxID=1770529 RepID=A0ABW5M1S5_9BACT
MTSVIKDNGGSAISQRGHVWSKTNAQPTLSDNKTELGATTGPFPLSLTDQLTNLENNTTYYIRPYAINSVGTAYGPVVQIKTATVPLLPTAPTVGLVLTRAASVSCTNIIENNGGPIIQWGFVWSKTAETPTPTLANNKRELGAALGSAPLSLSSILTDLTPGTAYSVRAFASNVNGAAYSPVASVQSVNELPNAVVDKPQGRSTGDPHFATYDNATYAFRGAGEFTVTKSTTDKFEVQARQQELKSLSSDGSVSFTTGLAINTGNDVVSIYPPNQIYVNKTLIGISKTDQGLSNGGQLNRYVDPYTGRNTVTVKTGQGDNVRIILYDTSIDYYVRPSASRSGKLIGLMGNFDGNNKNDVALPNGTAVVTDYANLYPAYANGWRIDPVASNFVYLNGQTSATFTDSSFPKKDVTISSSQRSQAEQACRTKGVTDPTILEECITDVAVTGNAELATRALDVQSNVGSTSTISIGNFADSNVPLGKLNNAAIANGGVDLTAPAKAGSEVPISRQIDMTGGFECSFEFSGTTEKRVYLKLNSDNGYTYIGLLSSQPAYGIALWDYAMTPSINKRDKSVLDNRLHTLRTVVRPSATGILTQIYLDNDLYYQCQNTQFTSGWFTPYKSISIATYSDVPSNCHIQNVSFKTL